MQCAQRSPLCTVQTCAEVKFCLTWAHGAQTAHTLLHSTAHRSTCCCAKHRQWMVLTAEGGVCASCLKRSLFIEWFCIHVLAGTKNCTMCSKHKGERNHGTVAPRWQNTWWSSACQTLRGIFVFLTNKAARLIVGCRINLTSHCFIERLWLLMVV